STNLGAPGYRDMDQPPFRGKERRSPSLSVQLKEGLRRLTRTYERHITAPFPAGHPQTSAARNDIWKTGRRLVWPSSGGTHTS
ncbi:hypothetical protein M9458_013876, partial [Cirrhinus mrigala]